MPEDMWYHAIGGLEEVSSPLEPSRFPLEQQALIIHQSHLCCPEYPWFFRSFRAPDVFDDLAEELILFLHLSEVMSSILPDRHEHLHGFYDVGLEFPGLLQGRHHRVFLIWHSQRPSELNSGQGVRYPI